MGNALRTTQSKKTHINKPWDWGTAFCGLKGNGIEIAVDFEDDVADPCKRCEKRRRLSNGSWKCRRGGISATNTLS